MRRSRGDASSILLGLALGLVFASLAIAVVVFTAPVPSGVARNAVAAAGDVGVVSARRAATPASRPIYRHSVIPGGVYSAEELVAATRRDPVVFAQYASAAHGAVRLSALAAPRRVYMSYRIGGRIYWTRNEVPLPAGEMTLTSGDVEIRARCGNQLSDTAMFPVADSEPDAVEFDRLITDEPPLLASRRYVFPPVLIGSTPGTSQTVTPSETLGPLPVIATGVPVSDATSMVPLEPVGIASTTPAAPPPAFPPVDTAPPTGVTPPDDERTESPTTPPGGGGTPPETPRVPGDYVPPPDVSELPVAVVPEPGTFVLLGSALTALAAMRLRQRRRARRDAKQPD